MEAKLPEYTIRRITKEDVEAFRAVRLRALKNNPEAFGSAYEEYSDSPIEHFAQRIPEPDSDSLILVAENRGNFLAMMGFIRSERLKTRHKSFIWGVYVDPEARGIGLARRLMTQVMGHARQLEGLRQVQLNVTAGNRVAINLYESFGFTIWGTEPESLQVGNTFYDEHYMVCYLQR